MALTVIGSPELISALKRVGERMPSLVSRAQVRAATHLTQSYRSAAPVRTGALRRSFGKSTMRSGIRGEIISEVGVRRDFRFGRKHPVKYAGFVERKRGFARSVFEAQYPIARRIMFERLKEGVQQWV